MMTAWFESLSGMILHEDEVEDEVEEDRVPLHEYHVVKELEDEVVEKG